MIDIPGYGTLAAEVVCTRMGIKSQHDTTKLGEAKAEVYLKGFTSGVMTVGNHAGVKVTGPESSITPRIAGVMTGYMLMKYLMHRRFDGYK